MSPMGSLLTERQKEELNKSILDYLYSAGFNSTFNSFKNELNNQIEFQIDPKAKWSGLLEKKWTSVIRLQKKIMDLERENGILKEELSSLGTTSSTRKGPQEDWIPGRVGARHTLIGHRSPITAVTFHPKFSSLASASEDSTIKIWDYETGDFELTLKGHTKVVCDIDFDSKGGFLVSCSSDLTIKLWDCLNNYRCIKTLYDHDHSVSSVKFLPGDTHIVSASRDQTIKIWEVATSFCVKTLRGHDEWVRGVWPWTHGKFIVSASNDQTARIWDLTTYETKMILRGHDHVVEIAVFSPEITHAAIREMAGIPVPTTNQDSKSRDTSPCFVATGSRDKTIKIWDCSSGQCLKTLVGHDNWIRSIIFHPNGRHLLSCSDDKTIRIWEIKSSRCIKVIEGHNHFITSMAWGRATCGGAPTPTPITSIQDNSTSNLHLNTFSNSRLVQVLATGSVDQSVKIWAP